MNVIGSSETEIMSQKDMDGLVSSINAIFTESAKEAGMCKSIRTNNRQHDKIQKPWFDRQCRELKRQYTVLKNKITKFSSTEDRHACDKAGKEYRKIVNRCKRKFDKKRNEQLSKLKSDNPKDYWKMLKRPLQQKEVRGTASLNDFKKHFQRLSFQEQASPTDDIILQRSNLSENNAINQPFTEEEVCKQIKKLKNNKAAGIDDILNEFIKASPVKLITVITKLFNIVLDSGTIPKEWGIGVIVPLFKNKGSANDPDNYRGITLLSCFGKLFTATINSRLTCFLDEVGALGDEQAGFRAQHSTTDHIYTLKTIIDFYAQEKQRLYCAFVDYKKAFDLVTRSHLWTKLLGNHINGKVFRVIYNLYQTAKSCVKVGNELSDFFPCNVGVRQGENLSPLLFSLFLNDFELHLSRSYPGLQRLSRKLSETLSDDDVEYFVRIFTLLYADDTVILAESATQLQKALDAAHDYCKHWGLSVNSTKTKIMIFSKGRIRNKPSLNFGGDELEVVNEYVYLGTTFSSNGSMKAAVEKQIAQANRALFKLRTIAASLNLSIDTQCELYDRMILPILLYGCEVWGTKMIDRIELFHRRFMKQLLKLPRSTANCMLYGELGRYSHEGTVVKRMISYWLRVKKGACSNLAHTMYLFQKAQLDSQPQQNPKLNWLLNVKSILDINGFSNILNCNEISKPWILKSLERRVKDIFVQKWNAEMETNSLCTNYRMFKNSHNREPYLTELPFKHSQKLLKFRCGIHKLPITQERQEHKAQGPSLQICPLCGAQSPCDESHYVLHCRGIAEKREKLFPNILNSYPHNHKLEYLFNVTQRPQLFKILKLIEAITSHFS